MKNVIIISGPAGSGKDAVIEGLRGILSFERVVTTTTRAIRPGEGEGNPYHFLNREKFLEKIEADEFIEHSTNENGELYGVTREEVERIGKLHSLVLWKLDWKGVQSVKSLFPEVPAILISAPLDILESRLRKRDGRIKDEAYFDERMNYTKEWMKHTDIYDYIVENEEDKLDETVEKVRAIIQGELAR